MGIDCPNGGGATGGDSCCNCGKAAPWLFLGRYGQAVLRVAFAVLRGRRCGGIGKWYFNIDLIIFVKIHLKKRRVAIAWFAGSWRGDRSKSRWDTCLCSVV